MFLLTAYKYLSSVPNNVPSNGTNPSSVPNNGVYNGKKLSSVPNNVPSNGTNPSSVPNNGVSNGKRLSSVPMFLLTAQNSKWQLKLHKVTSQHTHKSTSQLKKIIHH